MSRIKNPNLSQCVGVQFARRENRQLFVEEMTLIKPRSGNTLVDYQDFLEDTMKLLKANHKIERMLFRRFQQNGDGPSICVTDGVVFDILVRDCNRKDELPTFMIIVYEVKAKEEEPKKAMPVVKEPTVEEVTD